MDEGQPVIVIVPTPRRPELHGKVLANIAEVRARGARTIVVAEEGDTSVDEFAEVVFRVPPVPTLYAPLLTVVPLQLFACERATVKGLDVDQPRKTLRSTKLSISSPLDIPHTGVSSGAHNMTEVCITSSHTYIV